MGVNSFTINQHYICHIGSIIQHLGPLRNISARPLERMIGVFKRKIKSTSRPSENVANLMLSHHQFSRLRWEDHATPAKQFKSEKLSISQIEQKIQFDSSLLRLHEMVSQYLNFFMTEQATVLVLHEFILKKSNQVLVLKRGHKNPLVIILIDNNDNSENNDGDNSYMLRDNKKYQLCEVQAMFNIMNTNLALVKIISQVYKDDNVTQSYYYDEENIIFKWKIVNLKHVYQYAVAVESMLFTSRIYINW